MLSLSTHSPNGSVSWSRHRRLPPPLPRSTITIDSPSVRLILHLKRCRMYWYSLFSYHCCYSRIVRQQAASFYCITIIIISCTHPPSATSLMLLSAAASIKRCCLWSSHIPSVTLKGECRRHEHTPTTCVSTKGEVNTKRSQQFKLKGCMTCQPSWIMWMMYGKCIISSRRR